MQSKKKSAIVVTKKALGETLAATGRQNTHERHKKWIEEKRANSAVSASTANTKKAIQDKWPWA